MSAWRLSWNGLRTVTELEVKQRIRSPRWIWALVIWFVVIGAVTSLVISSVSALLGTNSTSASPGALAFGLNVYFVLGMGLIIAPTFTATSINGDRSAGTLATLQATRLSALEIASGKLVAALCAAGVFLVVALPFIAWSMVLGSISVWQVIGCFLVVFAEVAVVCAIGLGWSALISRAAGSTVLTYLCVVGLTVISTAVMGLLTPLTVRTETVRIWGLPPAVSSDYQDKVDQYWTDHPDGDSANAPRPPVDKCAWYDSTEEVAHTDEVWWITVANPFVIVADAAPLPTAAYENLSEYASHSGDPLALVRWGVRSLARPAATERDECTSLYQNIGYNVETDEDGAVHVTTSSGTPVNVESPVKRIPVSINTPIWPWGLGTNVLIGAVFFWIAVRRLRVPYGRLTSGTRVA